MGYFVVDARAAAWFARRKSAATRKNGAALGLRERPAMNAQELLQEISEYCRQIGLAESTFGRRAVNDGKLAARLRNGGRIPTDTLDRIRAFMAANPASEPRPAVIERPREPHLPPPLPTAPLKPGDPQRNFR